MNEGLEAAEKVGSAQGSRHRASRNSQGLGGGGSAGLEFFWEGWRQGATRQRHRSAAAWGLSLLSPPCGAGFVVLAPWVPPPAAKVCPGLERTTGMIGVSGCLALVAYTPVCLYVCPPGGAAPAL